MLSLTGTENGPITYIFQKNYKNMNCVKFKINVNIYYERFF